MAPFTLVSLLDVLRIAGGNLMGSLANVSTFAEMLVRSRGARGESVDLRGEAVKVFIASLAFLDAASTELEMVAAKAAAVRCRDVLARMVPLRGGYRATGEDIGALINYCGQLSQIFSDEMQGRAMFVLPVSSLPLLDIDRAPFGDAVEAAFPLAQEDIREAGQCLAYGRYTASVFHLMRTMEATVQVLATRVGVANIDKEWGKLLSDIGRAVEAMPKGAERNRWSESHSHLYHVKQAWRNDTMHPKKTYTAEEARAVYEAVKSFMAHLAPLVA